ncbi:MAG: hypothetical protein RJQ09_05190 [Cyclobacteriaceae bacterium]
MINNLLEDWYPQQRKLYYVLLGLLSIVFISSAIFIFRAENNVLDWLVTSSLETVQVPFRSVNVGLFQFDLTAENYLINQFYEGSGHQITPLSGYIFLAVFTVGLVFLLALSTYFSRVWYLVVMTGLCFVFVSFRFEQLAIFGWIDNTFLIIVLGLILPLSYYFHAIKTYLSLGFRLLSFALALSLIALVIALFSNVYNPFYFLISYGFVAPVVISIIFILIVSHEVVYFILYLASGSAIQRGKNGLTHFIVLSLIYLANVILVYLRNASVIDWDILYVEAFILLPISAIIGLWGFQKREILYGNIFTFRPIGGYLYLVLGVICFATIGYNAYTANDPTMEAFEDVIIFSHVGFGVLFFLYVISNFITPLSQGLAVFKIAYREANMPYISANIGGLVAAAALYFLSNQAALNQAIAGYYNGLGNTYTNEANFFLAKEYYRRGSIFGYNNHRSNYSMAELAIQDNDLDGAISRFKNATLKNPSEFAFINLANAQNEDHLFFDALFTLQEGVKRFPNSDKIYNNLGLHYKGTNFLDSAVYYMELGDNTESGRRTNNTNIVDVLTRNKIDLDRDSLILAYRNASFVPIKANLLAYSNNTGFWLQEPLEGPVSGALDLHSFAFIYNQGFAHLRYPRQKTIDAIDSYRKNQANGNFSSSLAFLKSILQYSQGNVNGAFRGLDVLQDDPQKSGYYNHLLGVLALEQDASMLAVDFFRRALSENYPDARVNLAIALAEAGEISGSLKIWEDIYSSDSSDVSKDMMLALNGPFIELLSGSDLNKYQAIRYRPQSFVGESLNILFESISDQQIALAALSTLIDISIKQGNYSDAKGLIEQLSEDTRNEGLWRATSNKLALYQIADDVLPITTLNDSIDIKVNWDAQNQKSDAYFLNLGMNNPFEGAQVIIASKYFKEIRNDDDKAYQILLSAIEVNPYSSRLTKAYILQSINVGLSNYAREELVRLFDLVPEQEFRQFEKLLEDEIKKFENFEFPVIDEE